MPAARHCSRSPAIALAVSARIGVCRPVARSCSRMTAVASSPPISGICTSIRMMSNGSDRGAIGGLPPVADDRHAVPLLLEQRRDQRLVGEVVFRDQHAQRPCRPR